MRKLMEEKGLDYFPTSAPVTNSILFLQVARMIMAGLEFKGFKKSKDITLISEEEISKRVPFNEVYFTGITR